MKSTQTFSSTRKHLCSCAHASHGCFCFVCMSVCVCLCLCLCACFPLHVSLCMCLWLCVSCGVFPLISCPLRMPRSGFQEFMESNGQARELARSFHALDFSRCQSILDATKVWCIDFVA